MDVVHVHDEGLDVFRGVDNPPVASLVVQIENLLQKRYPGIQIMLQIAQIPEGFK